MYRTIKVPFKASKNDLSRLYECNRISAKIWNQCLLESKCFSNKNPGKLISKTHLQQLIKDKYPLHSQSVQAVAHKYLFACNGSLEAIKKGIKLNYPHKQKKYFNTKWVQGFEIENNIIYLSMGNWNKKRQNPIKVKVPKLPSITIKEIELVFDRGLKLCLTYDDCIQNTTNDSSRLVASIDPGIIHSIASVDMNGNSLIITGRKQRSIHNFRNKRLAELKKKMSKCTKGSRQWKRYNSARYFIISKSNAALLDTIHKTTKAFTDWCIEQKITEVAMGNPDGVQRNTKERIKKKSRRVELTNWTFGKIHDQLEYKLKSYGITIAKQDESYTTQTCPVCGKRNKCETRNYECSCGHSDHRDLNGSKNILSKYLYGNIRFLCNTKKSIYLRIY